MHRFNFALSLVCLSVTGYTAEPRGFLATSVESGSAAVARLSDPDVASRYESHFKLSRLALESWFETLHPYRLKSAKTFVVYSLDETGEEVGKKRALKPGTGVLIDASGHAVLLERNGDPVERPVLDSHVLPEVGDAGLAAFADRVAPAAFQAPLMGQEMDMRSVEATGEAPTVAGELLAVEPTLAPESREELKANLTSDEPVTGGQLPPVKPVAAGAGPALAIAGLALGSIFLLLPHNPHHHRPAAPPPVPEPTPVLVFATLSGLALRKRVRR